MTYCYVKLEVSGWKVLIFLIKTWAFSGINGVLIIFICNFRLNWFFCNEICLKNVILFIFWCRVVQVKVAPVCNGISSVIVIQFSCGFTVVGKLNENHFPEKICIFKKSICFLAFFKNLFLRLWAFPVEHKIWSNFKICSNFMFHRKRSM
jgi:hypothetical protein